MALLFIDSFDHYQTADIPRKWTTTEQVHSPTIAVGSGRCDTNCLAVGVSQHCSKGFNAVGTTLVVGFAFKHVFSLLGGFFDQIDICTLGTASLPHVYLKREWADGSLVLSREDAGPNNPVILRSPADTIRTGEWYYLELKVVLHASAGSVELRVNGDSVASASGLKTLGQDASAVDHPATWTFIQFNESSTTLFYVDDFYLLDGDGATNNDFLGDCHIEYLRPTAPGTHQDFALTGAASHWEAVDDADEPDLDATYVSSSTIGHQDTNNYQDTNATDIVGLQISPLAIKNDSGTRAIATLVRHAGVTYTNATDAYPSQSNYIFLPQVYDVNPGTGAAWTQGDVNAGEFGVEVTV